MRGGVLMVIAVLLFGSALLRLGVEAAPTLAREAKARMAEDPPVAKPSPGAQMYPEDLQHVITALQQREARLDEREQALAERLEALSIADAAIERRLAALVEAEEQLRRTLAAADGAAEGDLTQLTGLYEKMKPKEAAALFEEMAPAFAAGFLSRMAPDAAAAIMAGLDPKTAYTVSVVLAGRNATVPTE